MTGALKRISQLRKRENKCRNWLWDGFPGCRGVFGQMLLVKYLESDLVPSQKFAYSFKGGDWWISSRNYTKLEKPDGNGKISSHGHDRGDIFAHGTRFDYPEDFSAATNVNWVFSFGNTYFNKTKSLSGSIFGYWKY